MTTGTDFTVATTIQRALAKAHELACAFLASLPERPVSLVPSADEMATDLDEALPETGSDPAAVLEEWVTRAERGITASPGPRFFGFVTGGVTPAALAGDCRPIAERARRKVSPIDRRLFQSAPLVGVTMIRSTVALAGRRQAATIASATELGSIICSRGQ